MKYVCPHQRQSLPIIVFVHPKHYVWDYYRFGYFNFIYMESRDMLYLFTAIITLSGLFTLRANSSAYFLLANTIIKIRHVLLFIHLLVNSWAVSILGYYYNMYILWELFLDMYLQVKLLSHIRLMSAEMLALFDFTLVDMKK